MHLAFSTSIEPTWDLPAVTNLAHELGYGGIEVQLPQPAAGDPAAGSPLQERDLVRLAFEQASVQLIGIAAQLHFTGEKERDLETSDAVRRVIELAARLKCPRIRVLDLAMPPRMSRSEGIMRLADRLAPLAELAADAGAVLLVQNALSFRSAGDLWHVIEQASHPALGVAWDPVAAALVGEPTALAVQVLNSRLQHVVLRDATFSGSKDDRRVEQLQRIGQGSLALRHVAERLRGIGFSDWMCVTYPPANSLGSPRELLQHAFAELETWKPHAPSKKTGRPAAVKPVH